MSYLLSWVGRGTGSSNRSRSRQVASPTRTIDPATDKQAETQHKTEFLFHDTVLIKSEKLPSTSD
jgi:hypothetical protein